MVELINKLYEGFLQANVKEILHDILCNLFDYTVYHFSYEEELFEKYGYSRTKEHKKEHEGFVSKIKEFKEKYNRGDAMLSYELMNFLRDWFLEHILVSDKHYLPEICKD